MSNLTKGCRMDDVNPLIIMAAGKGSRMRSGGNLPDWVLQEAASRPKAMIRLGKERKPLLGHLIEQAKAEGLRNICIVIGESDEVTPSHFDAHPVDGITLDFVVQHIASGRSKPEARKQWNWRSTNTRNGRAQASPLPTGTICPRRACSSPCNVTCVACPHLTAPTLGFHKNAFAHLLSSAGELMAPSLELTKNQTAKPLRLPDGKTAPFG